MLQHEKNELLGFFDISARWCQGSEAQDDGGNPVTFDDDLAVAWDLAGGMCRLFGWRRACQLFPQLDRHIHGKKRGFGTEDETVAAMSALFDFNDDQRMTYERVIATLQDMPVWAGAPRDGSAPREGLTKESQV